NLGNLSLAVAAELGAGELDVIAVATHDTGSAVAAVPAIHDETSSTSTSAASLSTSTIGGFAYISCGTWSLLGTEVNEPVITEQARELNFTNEGGVFGTYRLLKNIMGLWLLQESRNQWQREGKA